MRWAPALALAVLLSGCAQAPALPSYVYRVVEGTVPAGPAQTQTHVLHVPSGATGIDLRIGGHVPPGLGWRLCWEGSCPVGSSNPSAYDTDAPTGAEMEGADFAHSGPFDLALNVTSAGPAHYVIWVSMMAGKTPMPRGCCG